MKRKYLDDISVTNRPDIWNKKDYRQKQWKKERKIYGFDERETWNLELSFYLWLYERIKRYIEIAGIDLNYHKFNYKEKEYSQKEMLGMIIERLEFYFSSEYDSLDEENFNYVREAILIWYEIIGAVWW